MKEASPVPWDANRTRTRMRELANADLLASGDPDELADTLDLIAELTALGALSEDQAQRIIEGIADEQAALWAEHHDWRPLFSEAS